MFKFGHELAVEDRHSFGKGFAVMYDSSIGTVWVWLRDWRQACIGLALRFSHTLSGELAFSLAMPRSGPALARAIGLCMESMLRDGKGLQGLGCFGATAMIILGPIPVPRFGGPLEAKQAPVRWGGSAVRRSHSRYVVWKVWQCGIEQKVHWVSGWPGPRHCRNVCHASSHESSSYPTEYRAEHFAWTLSS